MNASKSGRLQMDGDEREAQFFVCDVRREELPLSDEGGFGWIKACDDLVSRFHNWKHNPFCKDFEAFIWTPKIGVLNDGWIDNLPHCRDRKIPSRHCAPGFQSIDW